MNKGGQVEEDLVKKPADSQFHIQQPKTASYKVTDACKLTIVRDVATQTRAQKRLTQAANPSTAEGSQAKIHNWLGEEVVGSSYQSLGEASNYQDSQQQLKPEQQQLWKRAYLEENDVKQLEMIFSSLTQYPDVNMMKELSVRLNVSKFVIDHWFGKKRSEYREKKEMTLKHFQVQAMQQQQMAYNQHHRHHIVSQPVVMAQASGSTSYMGRQQPVGGYFTTKHLTYLENLFTNSTHYPDISQLAVQLCVPERYLAAWFEKRRDAWKKEQASIAYSKMALMQQQQRQLQVSSGSSQVFETLCTEPSSFPEASNIPLVEKLLLDVATKPTLPLLSVPLVEKFLSDVASKPTLP